MDLYRAALAVTRDLGFSGLPAGSGRDHLSGPIPGPRSILECDVDYIIYQCNVRPTKRSIDMGTLPDTPGLLAISDLELK
jgi:hypothetical protein